MPVPQQMTPPRTFCGGINNLPAGKHGEGNLAEFNIAILDTVL
jgi:hypothetical protein